jgi:hypothetical protein
MSDPREEIVRLLSADRVLAHQALFKHRHPDVSPDFHRDMILDWHGPDPRVLEMVFRGGAKSTVAEEAITLGACFREFRNGLIVGESYDRAVQRLHAVKHELENNETIAEVFGDQRGPTWGEDKIVTASGIMIQALGRGQSLRGIKHLDMRPDFLLVDDIEGRDDVRTPEARLKVRRWFMGDLLPAMDPGYRARMCATPLDPEALAEMLAKDPAWVTRRIPIKYRDERGEWAPSWPKRFPLADVDLIEESYLRQGLKREFNNEYMVQAEAPEEKPFKLEMFRIEPQVRTWQNVFGMIDPARTVGADSATTGWVTWSWIGGRLVVWDAGAGQLLPDAIIDLAFTMNEDAGGLTWLGVEEDGLNQFLLQPLRQAQVKRGIRLPLQALKAPKGKLDFIRGLQPFFNAREVWFAKNLPDLQSQLLAFPTGKIDVPNALAYALKLRPGAPMYDDFGGRHVGEGLEPAPFSQPWLAVNAKQGLVTGVLLQLIDGCLRVHADYVREGDPGSELAAMVQEANLDAGRAVKLIGPPIHFDKFLNVGLRQAAAKLPMELRKGVPPEQGRPEIRSLLKREHRHMPMLLVADRARWVLNGFAGGYARQLLKGGVLAEHPEEGEYRVLMEGLESFAGLLRLGSPDSENDDRNYAWTPDGRRYTSALANRPRRG